MLSTDKSAGKLWKALSLDSSTITYSPYLYIQSQQKKLDSHISENQLDSFLCAIHDSVNQSFNSSDSSLISEIVEEIQLEPFPDQYSASEQHHDLLPVINYENLKTQATTPRHSEERVSPDIEEFSQIIMNLRNQNRLLREEKQQMQNKMNAMMIRNKELKKLLDHANQAYREIQREFDRLYKEVSIQIQIENDRLAYYYEREFVNYKNSMISNLKSLYPYLQEQLLNFQFDLESTLTSQTGTPDSSFVSKSKTKKGQHQSKIKQSISKMNQVSMGHIGICKQYLTDCSSKLVHTMNLIK